MNMFIKIISIGILMQFGANILHANVAVHPAKPRECYSCAGINCTLVSKLNVSVICPDMLDVCVTIFDQFAVAAKGCYSEMPETLRAKCMEMNNPECVKCYDQLCNNKARADVKCIECNSRKNPKCLTDPKSFSPVTCEIPTAQYSYCYVHDSSKGLIRGCYGHVFDQNDCLHDDDCSLCFAHDGIACNNYNVMSQSNKNRLHFWLQLSIILTFAYAALLK